MSSRIAMPLEAQASTLVSFLALAQHSLTPSSALEICADLRAAKVPPARFLKTALARHSIDLKHTSCLKAIALMDGFNGHVSRPKPSWVVAQYAHDAPAITPKVKRHVKSTDATADLCTRLTEALTGERAAPYARVVRHADYLEFAFIGEPLPGSRYLLVCKHPDGSTAMDEQEALSAVERVRRVVEGQFRGWLDGAAKIPVDKAGPLRLLKDGHAVAEGLESAILAACETDEEFELEAGSLLRQPVGDRRYRIWHAPEGGSPVLADDALVERLWRRLEAFYRFTEDDFSWFLSQRQQEQDEGRFHFDGIDTAHLKAVLADRNLSLEVAAEMAGMAVDAWKDSIEAEELPREALLRLVKRLGLASANELYVDSRAPVWMPVMDGQEIALWMRNFDHLHLSVSGIAEGAPLAQRCIEMLTKLRARAADAGALQAVLTEAQAGGLRLGATIEKRFVSDLPVDRERLAMVGHLSLWDRKEVERHGASGVDAEARDEQREWSPIEDEYLARFNSLELTADELIALQTEVARARRDGQEPGFETASFAAVRVFRGQPDAAHRAHTAMTRMTALSLLMRTGALAVWLEQSNEAEAQMVPKNVLQAAARCPLIRVGNEPGFDAQTFLRLALQFAATD